MAVASVASTSSRKDALVLVLKAAAHRFTFERTARMLSGDDGPYRYMGDATNFLQDVLEAEDVPVVMRDRTLYRTDLLESDGMETMEAAHRDNDGGDNQQ